MATTKKTIKGAKPAPKAASNQKKVVAAKSLPAKEVSSSKKSSVEKAVSKKEAVPVKKTAAKNDVTITSKKAPVKAGKIELKKEKSGSAKKATLTQLKNTITPEPSKKIVAKAVLKKIDKPVKKMHEETPKSKPAAVVVPKKAVVVPEKKSIAPPVQKSVAQKSTGQKAVSNKPAKPVVIPKTSTDKKVDYEPDFLKSVLDSPTNNPSLTTMRYSDAELNEFKELINKKLDAAKKELAYLQGLITRKDEMGGDETDNRYVTMEDGGMSMEREQLSQMASRQITFTDHLEKALMRIENKTYGICRVTGKLIDKARLRAVPHATLSMEAKLGIVK